MLTRWSRTLSLRGEGLWAYDLFTTSSAWARHARWWNYLTSASGSGLSMRRRLNLTFRRWRCSVLRSFSGSSVRTRADALTGSMTDFCHGLRTPRANMSGSRLPQSWRWRTPVVMARSSLAIASFSGTKMGMCDGLRLRAETGGFASTLSAMLVNCRVLHLVDPHFGPENPRHRKVLEPWSES